MATRRLRVEIIRFALLLTLTVALISVAARYDDHDSSRNQAARGHQQAASATPSQSSGNGAGTPAASPSTAPAQPSSTPSQSRSSAGRGSAGSGGGTAGSGGGSASSAGGAGGGSGSGAGTVATLPRTGGTQAVELAALAALFIASGSFGLQISRPRARTPQLGEPEAAVAQSGQAAGSSVSYLPGTI